MADVLKLMIIDEDLDRRITTRRAIQRARLNVAGEAGYGIKAVSLAQDAQADIFLLALEEPVGRPLETVEALANTFPNTPLIIYSSINNSESVRRAMLLGVRDYISQPVQADQLAETINSLLVREEQRQMRRAGQVSGPQGRGTVVTVTGGKGGIGKSVVSVNLALALRRETGMSVAIFDADTEFGDVATMLDISPDRTIADLLPKLDELDRDSIQEFLTKDEKSGVEILAAASNDGEVWGDSNPEDMKRIIDLLAQMYDFVIVDTGGAFDRFVRACVESSTLALIVTSGEVPSIRDAATAMRRLKSWEIPPERFEILVNRLGRTNTVPLDELSLAMDRKIFWEVPHDRRIPKSIQFGQPVVLFNDSSPAAQSLLSLSRRIAGTKKPLVRHQGKSLFKNPFKVARSTA